MFSNRPDLGRRLDRLQEIVPKGRRIPKPRTARQVMHRLTRVEVAQLVDAYLAGALQQDLAHDFKVHPQTVSAVLSRVGVPRRNQGLHGDRLEVARALYLSGKSLDAVGRELKVSGDTVRRYLRSAGEDLRPRSGWRPPQTWDNSTRSRAAQHPEA
jgi:hypothetical protein